MWCVEAANEVLPAELPLGGLYDVPKEVSWMKVLEIHWMTDRGCREEDGIVLDISLNLKNTRFPKIEGSFPHTAPVVGGDFWTWKKSWLNWKFDDVLLTIEEN